jgi:hypothetical protein
MFRILQYNGRWQEMRGRFGGLPGWARALVWLAALPGLLLAGLSLLVLLGSILALLLLALPVYTLLKSLLGGRRDAPDAGFDGPPGEDFGGPAGPSPGRKRVSATVIESFEGRITP